MAEQKNLIPCAQEDFLDSDPLIRGQKYVCLSFISPEDAIKNKETYFFKKYLESFSQDLTALFVNSKETFKENLEFVDALHGLQERYSHLFNGVKLNDEFDFFKANHGATLESEYLEENNFQTSIRGLKVRGSYESLKEAQIRAQVLKRMDDRFNVFIAQVGCWCPWSPNPDELENQEYAETQLNTLVKNYYDNQQEKDEFFMKRKDMLRSKAIEENKAKNPKKEDDSGIQVVEEGIQAEDPWMQRKKEEDASTLVSPEERQQDEASVNSPTIVSPEVKDEHSSTESV